MKFSIIIVCLNSGNRLLKTLESIMQQTYEDYEVIVKDGCSRDGSVENIMEKLASKTGKSMKQLQEKIHIYVKQDKGIYDAMNQAITYAKGEYYLFLNTGDDLYCKSTLQEVAQQIKNTTPGIVYGDLYHKQLNTLIKPSPQMTDFACYRNVPCHQSCFYHHRLFKKRGYDQTYNVRGDYEHFLWCIYEAKAVARYIPVTVASYEGGGYSETKENRKRSAKQHREIVVKYMGKRKANRYRRIMWMTLAPLRTMIAESKTLSGSYNHLKGMIYQLIRKS